MKKLTTLFISLLLIASSSIAFACTSDGARLCSSMQNVKDASILLESTSVQAAIGPSIIIAE